MNMNLKKINMSDVAMFVAASLNYPSPTIDSSRPVSTIRVNQFKTKFGEVRIYCQLAHPELVKTTWEYLGNEGEPSQQFLKNRMRWDARHYRDCYLSMVNILSNIPDGEQFISSLLNGADYRELLYKDKDELNDSIIRAIEGKNINYFYEKWCVDNSDNLLQILADFSGFNRGLFEQ